MKLKNIILGLLVVLGVASCTKSLDLAPMDTITEGYFWKSTKDAELYANQFYALLPDHRSASAGAFVDDISDNQYNVSTVLQGTRTVPATGGGWDWTTVRKINYFFENCDKIPGGRDAIKQGVGEMYFFKAWVYFGLVNSFGDLPWYNKTLNTNSEELYAPRVSRAVITDSILAQLDNAIAYLPEKANVPTDRISKDLALAFKVRICLFEGTWEKYHSGDPFGVAGSDGSKYLNLAVTTAQTLMDKGIYDIYNPNLSDKSLNYFNLFNQNDYTNNNEVLWFRKYSAALSFTNNIQYQGGNTINLSLVNAYLCKDGKPIYNTDGSKNSLYLGDSTIQKTFSNRDPRLPATIWQSGELSYYGRTDTTQIILYGSYSTPTGFQMKKGNAKDFSQFGLNASLTACIGMRYAEVLLSYAEAKAELGTITQADLDATVNKTRGRVGMPALTLAVGFTDSNWDFPALSPLINEIRRERRVELAMENGLRRMDIFRWAAADELIIGKRPKGIWFNQSLYPTVRPGIDILVDAKGYLDPQMKQLPNGFGFNVNRDYLSPLPSNELVLNTNLKQNPGWQ